MHGATAPFSCGPSFEKDAHTQVITHRDLSHVIAQTIVETSSDSCKANGYSVSAVVVDRASEVIVALRGDNAGPHTMENTGRKAYTARSFLHFNRCLRQAVRR